MRNTITDDFPRTYFTTAFPTRIRVTRFIRIVAIIERLVTPEPNFFPVGVEGLFVTVTNRPQTVSDGTHNMQVQKQAELSSEKHRRVSDARNQFASRVKARGAGSVEGYSEEYSTGARAVRRLATMRPLW
jgi:hypothetical protein